MTNQSAQQGGTPESRSTTATVRGSAIGRAILFAALILPSILLSSISIADDTATSSEDSVVAAAPVIIPSAAETASEVAPVAPREEPSIPDYLWSEALRLAEHFFRLRDVQITGAYRLDREQAATLAGVSGGPWIWEVYTRDIAADLKRSPWVENAEVEWSVFPPAVSISIKESEPWMVAELKNAGDSWIVSRTGKLLQSSSSLRSSELVLETAELPRLDGVRLTEEEDLSTVTRRLDYTVRMLRMIDVGGGVPFPAERYSLLPGGGVLVVPAKLGEPQVALMPQTFEEARSQLQELEAVLADLRRRNESPKRIDLRFSGRAVVTL